MNQQIEDLLDSLSDADTKTVIAVANQMKDYYTDVEKAAKARLLDRLESTTAENAMLGDQPIAIIQRRNGSSKETYKVKDMAAYGQWLKGNECVVDGNPAYTDAPIPVDAATTNDYIAMLVRAGEGELPAGIQPMTSRPDTIMCKPLPGVGERLIGGDLAPRVQAMMLTQITSGKAEE